MAVRDNVQKRQLQQGVEGRAHIAGGRRTLPDQRKTPAKTTNRPSRTLRPFIWPSVGWCLSFSSVRTSFFSEARWAAPAYEFARESHDVAFSDVRRRRADWESAS
jgi:hypothetical protein